VSIFEIPDISKYILEAADNADSQLPTLEDTFPGKLIKRFMAGVLPVLELGDTQQPEVRQQSKAVTLFDQDIAVSPSIPERSVLLTHLQTAFQVDCDERDLLKAASREQNLQSAAKLFEERRDRILKYSAGYMSEGDAKSLLLCYAELSRIYLQQGRAQEAKHQQESAIELCDLRQKRESNWLSDRPFARQSALLRLELARMFEAEGNNDKALTLQFEALSKLQGSRDAYKWESKQDIAMMACHDEMARILMKQGKFEMAKQQLEQAFTLSELMRAPVRLSDEQLSIKMNAKVHLAEVYLYTGQAKKSLELYMQAVPLLQELRRNCDARAELDMDKRLYAAYRGIANAKATNGDISGAIKDQQDLQYRILRDYRYPSSKSPVDMELAQCRRDLAELHLRKGDYKAAVAEIEEEIKIYERGRTHSAQPNYEVGTRVFNAQNRLVAIFEQNNQPLDSINVRKVQLANIVQSLNPTKRQIAECQQAISMAYEGMNDRESAIYWQKCANYNVRDDKDVSQQYQDRLKCLYAAEGKELRVEEAKEDKESFEKLDKASKLPYLLYKLPEELDIRAVPGEGTTIKTNDFQKLLNVGPGNDVGLLFADALRDSLPPETLEKTLPGLIEMTKAIKELKFKGNRLEITMDREVEVPFPLQLPIGQIQHLKVGPKLSFNIEVDPIDPSKLILTNVEGLKIATVVKYNGVDFPVPPVVPDRLSFQDKIESGVRKRYIGISTIPDRDKPINAFPLPNPVSDDSALKFQHNIKQLVSFRDALGKGEMGGILGLFGQNDLSEGEKAMVQKIVAIKKGKNSDKYGSTYEVAFSVPHSVNIAEFVGNTARGITPMLHFDQNVSFRIMKEKYSLDLRGASGIRVEGIFQDVMSWDAQLLGVEIGIVHADGTRSFEVRSDGALGCVQVKLDSDWKLAPNTKAWVGMRQKGQDRLKDYSIQISGAGKPDDFDLAEVVAGYLAR
jgi:hypothetical protein